MKKISRYLPIIIAIAVSGCNELNLDANKPPVIKEIVLSKKNPLFGETITVTARAEDPEGDTLSYDWECSAGVLGNEGGSTVTWTAPQSDAIVTISVNVSDKIPGNAVTGSVEVGPGRPVYQLIALSSDGGTISLPDPIPAEVVHGIAQRILAVPGEGYQFYNWTPEGSSEASFANGNSADTTVTLTNGNAIIKANFVRDGWVEFVPFISESVGTSYDPAAATAYVQSASGINRLDFILEGGREYKATFELRVDYNAMNAAYFQCPAGRFNASRSWSESRTVAWTDPPTDQPTCYLYLDGYARIELRNLHFYFRQFISTRLPRVFEAFAPDITRSGKGSYLPAARTAEVYNQGISELTFHPEGGKIYILIFRIRRHGNFSSAYFSYPGGRIDPDASEEWSSPRVIAWEQGRHGSDDCLLYMSGQGEVYLDNIQFFREPK
ncbi:MAG: hypothetical protein JW881_08895 [Spirochaetales bacterium]|nr:hypothetical protein [Spirochaetales bacterium]